MEPLSPAALAFLDLLKECNGMIYMANVGDEPGEMEAYEELERAGLACKAVTTTAKGNLFEIPKKPS